MHRIITILMLAPLFLCKELIAQGCWKQIAMPTCHNAFRTVGIATDGTLWGWGFNGSSHILVDTPIDFINTPMQIGSDTQWAFVATGAFFNAAIKEDGTLWTWGANNQGQLGLGHTNTLSIPTQVGNDNHWRSVSGGYEFCMATKTDGTLWVWGDNSYGQFGDNSAGDSYVPKQIGTDTNWKNISASSITAFATKTNGTLWSWGWNSTMLGYTTTLGKNPITQIGNASNWDKISAGWKHCIATKTDGTLWSWGDHSAYFGYGLLGNGLGTDSNIPVQVGTDTNWSEIAASLSHSCAIKTNGTLWTWGANLSSGLGNGNSQHQPIPIQIGTSTNWSKLACGCGYSIHILSDGSLRACGVNNYGVLGNGTFDNTSTYQSVFSTPVVSNLNPVCANTSGQIIVNPNTNLSFGWYDAPTGGNLLAINDTFNTPILFANQNYWVQTLGGCGLENTRTLITQTVLAKPTVTASASNTKVCKNSSIVLNGGGAINYTWSPNATNNIAFPISSNTIFTVTGSDANACTNTSTIEIQVNPLPNIVITPSEDTLCNGDVTMLSATGGSAYTWTGGIFDQTPFIPTSTTTYTVTGTGAFSCTSTAVKTVVVRNCNLQLKLYLQGYYLGNETMQPVLYNEGIQPYPSYDVDTVTVELHKYFSPYELVETRKGILRLDGTLWVHFEADPNNSYYLVLKHRNHIAIWSSSATNFLSAGSVINFTANSNKIYDDNVAEVEPGIFALYSGDPNQDDVIDAFDYMLLEPEIVNGTFGYNASDLNGDGVVDAFDYLMLEPNIVKGIGVSMP